MPTAATRRLTITDTASPDSLSAPTLPPRVIGENSGPRVLQDSVIHRSSA
ncbi:hypothetical protein [Acinetobacter baumannii]